MATTTLLNSAASYGIAADDEETFNPAGILILGGDIETISATLVNPAADVAAFTVLGKITTGGKLTPCDLTAIDGSAVPYAIAMYDIADPNADVTIQVYRSGVFNMDALVWDASFDTDAKKLAAFDGTNPQTIFIRRPVTGSPS